MQEDGLEKYLDKFSKEDRIAYIHFRNVKGKIPNYVEAFVDDVPIKIIKIEKKVETIDKNKSILIEPSKISLEIDFEINFKNKFINNQRNLIKDRKSVV